MDSHGIVKTWDDVPSEEQKQIMADEDGMYLYFAFSYCPFITQRKIWISTIKMLMRTMISWVILTTANYRRLKRTSWSKRMGWQCTNSSRSCSITCLKHVTEQGWWRTSLSCSDKLTLTMTRHLSGMSSQGTLSNLVSFKFVTNNVPI